ncbi:uncharacterized protein L3040_004187 [Drepanopeziza brunnea f. sp. 'multigermtubi']|uniref:uncharacterized protein n=1 Tax=Drepanopeziza brunnea f. sp. 'multigermtubi' TaxID=698441 RepID=UPI0023A24526|nr:hypothetical protein L3040_004187 [Drepanopeziza brunnea f. sp. 'multigermtubi']
MAYEIVATCVPAVVTSVLFTSVAFICVVARLYTRHFMLQNAGTDDYLIIGAMAASIGFCVIIFYQIQNGLGRPFLTLSEATVLKFLQCLWATIPTYNLALVLTKISIVFQYKRIFTARKIIRLCNIMIGILSVYGLWAVFGSTFMCLPVSNFWNTGISVGCMEKTAFWFSNAALNIATDILIFSIPMPLLKQLQLPKKQKIGLMFVFGFGAFVCVTSVIRLKSLHEISASTDTTLDGVNAGIWSGIEINVAIACASLPSIKPLISRVAPRLFSTRSTSCSRSNVNNAPDAPHYGSFAMKSSFGGSKGMGGSNVYAVGKINTTGGSGDIKIQKTVIMQREVRPNSDGSESSLVFKTDCYSEERNQKITRETV